MKIGMILVIIGLVFIFSSGLITLLREEGDIKEVKCYDSRNNEIIGLICLEEEGFGFLYGTLIIVGIYFSSWGILCIGRFL